MTSNGLLLVVGGCHFIFIAADQICCDLRRVEAPVCGRNLSHLVYQFNFINFLPLSQSPNLSFFYRNLLLLLLNITAIKFAFYFLLSLYIFNFLQNEKWRSFRKETEETTKTYLYFQFIYLFTWEVIHIVIWSLPTTTTDMEKPSQFKLVRQLVSQSTSPIRSRGNSNAHAGRLGLMKRRRRG